jgi:hypothetical protein
MCRAALAQWVSGSSIGRLSGDAVVAVVEAADLGGRDDASGGRRCNRARDRPVFVQREMRARVQVVRDVVSAHSL